MNTHIFAKLCRLIARGIVPVLLSSIVGSILLTRCAMEDGDKTINLYCYSAMKDVMIEGIIPAFQTMYQAQNKSEIKFKTNCRGSVELTRIITTKQSADIAILASEIDAVRLINHGTLAERTWVKSPYNGILARTPLLVIYYPDEVDEITDFDDLAQSGVKLIHPSPLYSGLGEWGLMASYGSFLLETGDSLASLEKLKMLWGSVALSPCSAFMARNQYIKKNGNAILTYESELLGSSKRQVMDGKVWIPSHTIMCEPLAVIVPQQVSTQKERLIKDFHDFLWSNHAQQIFVNYGFRSVADRLNSENQRFVRLDSTFTLESLGGVRFVKCQLIEDIWQNEIRKPARSDCLSGD